MRVEYNEENDYAYISLREVPGFVSETVEATEDINLDLDRKGRLVGIEVLSARARLPGRFLSRFANRNAKPSY